MFERPAAQPSGRRSAPAAATVPPIVTSPPSSTSTPRPRMKTARGASDLHREVQAAAAGGAGGRGGAAAAARARAAAGGAAADFAHVGQRRARWPGMRFGDADLGALDAHLAGQRAAARHRPRQAQIGAERGGDEVGDHRPRVAGGDGDVGREAGGADVDAAPHADGAVAGRAPFEALDHQARAVAGQLPARSLMRTP